MLAQCARVAVSLVVCLTAGCGGKGNSPAPQNPASPTPAAPTVQAVRISGGSTVEAGRLLVLSVARLMSDGSTQPLSPSDGVQWQSGNTVVLTVSPGGVVSAQQAGVADVRATWQQWTDVRTITVTQPPPPFSRSGSGADVFSLPSHVSRVRITGDYDGRCENFVVWVGGRLAVNEIMGSCSVATTGRHYTGVHLVQGTLVEITHSTGIRWTITQQ